MKLVLKKYMQTEVRIQLCLHHVPRWRWEDPRLWPLSTEPKHTGLRPQIQTDIAGLDITFCLRKFTLLYTEWVNIFFKNHDLKFRSSLGCTVTKCLRNKRVCDENVTVYSLAVTIVPGAVSGCRAQG